MREFLPIACRAGDARCKSAFVDTDIEASIMFARGRAMARHHKISGEDRHREWRCGNAGYNTPLADTDAQRPSTAS